MHGRRVEQAGRVKHDLTIRKPEQSRWAKVVRDDGVDVVKAQRPVMWHASTRSPW